MPDSGQDPLKLLKPMAAEPDPVAPPVRGTLWAILRKCPQCRSTRVCPSHHRDQYEIFILPMLFRRPFRCLACHFRFYGFDFSRMTVKQAMVGLSLIAVAGYCLWCLIDGFSGWNSDFNLFR